MRNALIALFFTVLGGIIIALFQYVFLQDRAGIPDIDIQERTSAIPVESAKLILLPNVTKDASYFAGVYVIQTFDIKNNASKIYKGILFRPTKFEIAVIQHDGKTETLNGDKLVDMNPGDTITVSGVASGYNSPYGITDAGKLLVAVGDVPIPVRIAAVDEGNMLAPVIAFAVNNPFTAYMAMMLMAVCTIVILLAMLAAGIVSLNPVWKFKYFSNKQFAEELAFLNYMKKHDEERFEEVRKMAEKLEKTKLPKIVDATN